MKITNDKSTSTWGTVSILLSAISIVSIFMITAIAGLLQSVLPYGLYGEPTASALIGIFLFLFFIVSIISLFAGTMGIVKRESNLMLPTIGVSISTITILGTAFVVIFGLLIS